ncbi:MAG TPA: phosphatase PAP2 family protein [Gemmatimonadales bacterium]|nr:phosphatase PAP2 family protein [Gemmatimonadales bacterium]
MRWVTHFGDAVTTVGIALVLMLAGGHLAEVGRAALLANALSHVAVQVLKRTVVRARPCDADGVPLAMVWVPDPFSFPSGHSAASMAVAGTIGFAHPALAPATLGLAAVVGVSRVKLRVHHPGDVVAGAALGLGGALAARLILA